MGGHAGRRYLAVLLGAVFIIVGCQRAIDIGTLYYTGFKGLRIGAAITNFGPSMQCR